MEEKKLGNKIVKLLKTDGSFCKLVKHGLIKAQDYELAADVRNIEIEYFDKLKSDSEEYIQISKFNDMLKMAGLSKDLDMGTAYLLFNIAKLSQEKGIQVERFEDLKLEAASKF